MVDAVRLQNSILASMTDEHLFPHPIVNCLLSFKFHASLKHTPEGSWIERVKTQTLNCFPWSLCRHLGMPNEGKRGAQHHAGIYVIHFEKIISDNQDEVVASLRQRAYQIDSYLLKRVSCCDDLMERGFMTAEEDFVSELMQRKINTILLQKVFRNIRSFSDVRLRPKWPDVGPALASLNRDAHCCFGSTSCHTTWLSGLTGTKLLYSKRFSNFDEFTCDINDPGTQPCLPEDNLSTTTDRSTSAEKAFLVSSNCASSATTCKELQASSSLGHSGDGLDSSRRERASAFWCFLPLRCLILKSYSVKASSQPATWPSGSLKFINHV